jgi:UDP-N-acetylglucosamine 3-dehydrogenase
MELTYNVAIVGLGIFGKLHLDVLYNKEKVKVIAVCDKDPQRWNLLKEDYPNITFYSDIDRMLIEEPDIKVVHITTDEQTHFNLADKVLAYNKHVFVEKPLVTTLDDANTLLLESKKRQLKIGTGHLLRFEARHKDLKRVISNGKLGKVECITLRRNFKRSMLNHYGRVNAFITALIHDIDLIQYFTGSKVNKGTGTQLLPSHSSYRYNSAVLETENETVCSLENIWMLPEDYPYDMDFEVVIYGSDGVARTRINPDVEIFTSQTKYSELLLGEALEKELTHFITCILTNSDLLQPTLEESIHNVEVALHLIEQASKNKPIDLRAAQIYI